MKFIYPIGDSHTCMFQECYRKPGTEAIDNPHVKFLYLGGVSSTAYGLSEHDSEVMELLSAMTFYPGDETWFIFGEIDIRFQIFYQHQKLGITLDKSIEDMVLRYTNYVKSVVDRGYPVRIVSITPTQLNDVPHHNDPLHHLTMLNPVRGEGITLADRIYMTEKANTLLRARCKKLKIKFVNLYSYLVNPETRCIRKELCKDDGMHGYYIGDWVIKKFKLENNGA